MHGPYNQPPEIKLPPSCGLQEQGADFNLDDDSCELASRRFNLDQYSPRFRGIQVNFEKSLEYLADSRNENKIETEDRTVQEINKPRNVSGFSIKRHIEKKN